MIVCDGDVLESHKHLGENAVKKIDTFPQVIIVSVENPDSPDEFLSTSLTNSEALSDEESKIVGVYKFVEAHEIMKSIPTIKVRRSRKTK